MYRRFIPLTLGALALVLVTACDQALAPDPQQAAFAQGSNTDPRIEILLAGSPAFPEADGKARFRDRGGEQELQIGVEDGPANTLITFWVGGQAVDAATTDGIGDAGSNLNSDRGDAVPSVGAGTTVEVRIGTAAGGALVVSGAF